MKAAQLRQSILQAAVQGKLVPQNVHDEPASELLARIRKEKEQLVKEGKIKKEKPLPPIEEDDIPYDLPDGWVWCRLGNICSHIADIDHNMPSAVEKGVLFLSAKDLLDNGTINYTEKVKYISEEDYERLGRKVKPQKNDIIYSRIGACLGKARIVYFDVKFLVSYSCCTIRPLGIDLKYLYRYLDCGVVLEQATRDTQSIGVPDLGLQKIREFCIAVPPLAEQQRIVAKVDELMSLCDELEVAEKELNELETHFAEYLPKSILQAAVQGKLVPQNVHDEPASELLARIRQEKARLVKEGKIKKEKHLSPITEDEIPYDLPDGWVWCRIGNIIQLTDNDNIQSNYFQDTMINYVDIDAIDNQKYKITTAKCLPVKSLSSRARRVLKKDYIMYSLVRPYLNNIAIVEEEKENYIGSTGFVVFKPVYVPNKFFMAILLCPYIEEYFLSLLSGFNSPSVSQDSFLSTLIPLPPLAEQQRIVAKVDELMSLCDELKAAKEIPAQTVAAQILPFPQADIEEDFDIGIAARGDGEELPPEALADIAKLFGEDENA